MRWDGSRVARHALRITWAVQKWILRMRQCVLLDPYMNRRRLGHAFARRVRVSRESVRASHCMREGSVCARRSHLTKRGLIIGNPPAERKDPAPVG